MDNKQLNIQFSIPIAPNKEYIGNVKQALDEMCVVDDAGEKVLDMSGWLWDYRQLYLLAHFLEQLNQDYERHLEGITNDSD